MPSIRTDKQIFPFFDSVKTPITVAGTSDSFHNNGYDTMTLAINGTAEGYVEGCVNIINADGTTKEDNECVWCKLGLINMQDFNVTQGFAAEGHYCVGINGMGRVRVVISTIEGPVTVVAVAEA